MSSINPNFSPKSTDTTQNSQKTESNKRNPISKTVSKIFEKIANLSFRATGGFFGSAPKATVLSQDQAVQKVVEELAPWVTAKPQSKGSNDAGVQIGSNRGDIAFDDLPEVRIDERFAVDRTKEKPFEEKGAITLSKRDIDDNYRSAMTGTRTIDGVVHYNQGVNDIVRQDFIMTESENQGKSAINFDGMEQEGVTRVHHFHSSMARLGINTQEAVNLELLMNQSIAAELYRLPVFSDFENVREFWNSAAWQVSVSDNEVTLKLTLVKAQCDGDDTVMKGLQPAFIEIKAPREALNSPVGELDLSNIKVKISTGDFVKSPPIEMRVAVEIAGPQCDRLRNELMGYTPWEKAAPQSKGSNDAGVTIGLNRDTDDLSFDELPEVRLNSPFPENPTGDQSEGKPL